MILLATAKLAVPSTTTTATNPPPISAARKPAHTIHNRTNPRKFRIQLPIRQHPCPPPPSAASPLARKLIRLARTTGLRFATQGRPPDVDPLALASPTSDGAPARAADPGTFFLRVGEGDGRLGWVGMMGGVGGGYGWEGRMSGSFGGGLEGFLLWSRCEFSMTGCWYGLGWIGFFLLWNGKLGVYIGLEAGSLKPAGLCWCEMRAHSQP